MTVMTFFMGLLRMGRFAGWAGLGLTAAQIHQLHSGHALPELLNYATVAGSGLTALLLVGIGHWQAAKQTSRALPADPHASLIAAIDLLFAHFPLDPTAREGVRVVARAVTEQRYRITETKPEARS